MRKVKGQIDISTHKKFPQAPLNLPKRPKRRNGHGWQGLPRSDAAPEAPHGASFGGGMTEP